tara:strand:- start:376 stop:504 length:129 start_codon:yes stop_codon:yes gene_type:complete
MVVVVGKVVAWLEGHIPVVPVLVAVLAQAAMVVLLPIAIPTQ